MRRSFCALAVLMVLAADGGGTLALRAGPVEQDPPTFRSGVKLIEVDVVVTDRNGKPVRDLTSTDFEIVEDGRLQQVRTFSLIDLPLQSPVGLEFGRRDIEQDVVTNTAPEGRTYVLLVDTAAPRARHIAERWLDEVVQPNDRVAVVHAQGSFSDGQPFTDSRRLILNSINRMILDRGPGAIQPPVTRSINTLRAMKDIAERLGTIAGRRKAIVWITASPPPLHIDLEQGQVNRNFNDFQPVLASWQEAARAAVNNNVAIYPVDPDGLTTALGMASLIAQASMREVAEETGGVPVGVNSNNFSDGFATIVQDASTYYLLGYTPEPEQTDGKFHPIRVRVKRDGVTVRARRGYYAPDPSAAPPRPLPAPPEGVSVAARDVLRRPVAVPGLGVDVTTTALKGNGTESTVVITAHVRGKTLDYDAGRRLAVSYQVFDLEGKVATGFYNVFGFNLGSESKAQASGTGLQFVERISLKPGRYELRLVAEQPGGPMGSVVAPIDAEKFEDDLELSGVALGSRRANEVLLVGDRDLRGALSTDPTARRSFRATDGLSAYAEVYTPLKDDAPPARVALIRVATLAAAISSPTGETVARGQSQRILGEPAGKTLREGFRTDFDLTRLKPGSYVLTLEARTSSDRKKVATRQIPFTLE